MVVIIRIIVFFIVTLCGLQDITILEEIAASIFMVEDGGNRFFQNVGTQYKVT
jgi:hypothetical protein